MPTTNFLEGYVDFDDKDALLKSSTNDNQFNDNVVSPLGTIYQDEQHLLSAYQSKHSKFKMKIIFLNKNVLKTKIIEIDWKDIQITKQKDSTIPTFLFDLKTIRL